MNILITGGAGFIGSTLCNFLLEQGEFIICYDNFDPFYPAAAKQQNLEGMIGHERFILIEGDINDTTLLSKVFTTHKIDLVIHMAAKAGVRPSIMNPRAYEQVNINGTINLLETMKAHEV